MISEISQKGKVIVSDKDNKITAEIFTEYPDKDEIKNISKIEYNIT